MSAGEEEALAVAQLKHAAVLLAQLARVCRLGNLVLLVAAVTAGCRIKVLENLIAKISGARANDVAGIIRGLEHGGTHVARHLLGVGRSATSITRHLADDAARLFKNTLVIENRAGLAACSLAIVILIVEGIVGAPHKSRVQQIVVLIHLGRSLLLEELLDVLCDGRRHVLETVASFIFARGEEASVLIEVPVDLLDLGHLPTRLRGRAKTAISRAASAGLALSLASRCNLVRNVVDFGLEGFALLLSKISHLIAVEFFPSLGL